jgi:hypothetical protein
LLPLVRIGHHDGITPPDVLLRRYEKYSNRLGPAGRGRKETEEKKWQSKYFRVGKTWLCHEFSKIQIEGLTPMRDVLVPSHKPNKYDKKS